MKGFKPVLFDTNDSRSSFDDEDITFIGDITLTDIFR